MTESVIHAQGLGKRYRVGEFDHFVGLREVLSNALAAPFRPRRKTKPDYLWAIRNVDLDVKQSEVLGLIGSNGAGKSTLLKLLARITRPTEGWAEIHGRVGSLLEVGTGFHPELTGRENIYLSGAILGMRKVEIDRKFDEIVAFSEVERFLNTPLKRYSSGMQVRLAFSVAAHLEPEILLVDEVLSVGDLQFQKKCLGKMGDVAKTGRTIVFVSHQLNQIRRLCQRVIWVEGGKIRQDGTPQEVASAYELQASTGERSYAARARGDSVKAEFVRWAIQPSTSGLPNVLGTMGCVRVSFEVLLNQHLRVGHHGIGLYDSNQRLLWGMAVDNLDLAAGTYSFVHELPSLPLRPGPYTWRVTLWDEHGLIDDWHCVPEMIVATAPVTHPKDEWAGFLNIPEEFSVVPGLDGAR